MQQELAHLLGRARLPVELAVCVEQRYESVEVLDSCSPDLNTACLHACSSYRLNERADRFGLNGA
jgi:hypothetical protein